LTVYSTDYNPKPRTIGGEYDCHAPPHACVCKGTSYGHGFREVLGHMGTVQYDPSSTYDFFLYGNARATKGGPSIPISNAK